MKTILDFLNEGSSKSLTQFILETNTKKWFPKINKTVNELWDNVVEGTLTGKKLIDKLYKEFFKGKINEITKDDLAKIFSGFEDNMFSYCYGSGAYGGQEELGEFEEEIFGGYSILDYEDRADLNLSKDTKEAGACELLRFKSNNGKRLFCYISNGDNGGAYYLLSLDDKEAKIRQEREKELEEEQKRLSKLLEDKKPKDVDELRLILEHRLKDDKNADLNDIDVSNIDSFFIPLQNGLFGFLDPHDIKIDKWKFKDKPLDLSRMFSECVNFTGKGLDKWNIKISKIQDTFLKCRNFNCDLSNWDVSNCTNMSDAFLGCREFEGKGLEKWDISNVTYPSAHIFLDCPKISDKIKNKFKPII